MIFKILTITFLSCQLLFAQPAERTNSIGMELVLIKPGEVRMAEFSPPYPVPEDTMKSNPLNRIMWMGDGRSYNEDEFEKAKVLAERDSRPGFPVVIKKAFYIGKFEVTQAQWRKVMGSNPSQFKNAPGADSLPVENVSWNDVQIFLKKLNRLERTKQYRLPTEIEWEYAARAGATGDIPWKQIDASANLNKKMPIRIGSKRLNAWGLYDMLGNVWEWVSDIYNEKIFADPVPTNEGKQHVLKGASFVGDVKNATYMTHAGGPANGWDVGFRVVLEVEQ